MSLVARRRLDREDARAAAARARVVEIIDSVPPIDLVAAIKAAPSLRGMILGYLAEAMFERLLPQRYPSIDAADITRHDDHDRAANKSDRTIRYQEIYYRIQIKSIQTNSIGWDAAAERLEARVQNDAPDRRQITLPDGQTVETTCYARGDYDILAVPLFPLSGTWDFAYKRNVDCRPADNAKYPVEIARHLLATTEVITWPLTAEWTPDFLNVVARSSGISA
ncbi:MAG: hypothetical protein ACP5NP_00670 [Acetobacteraceae bacterium]